MVLLRSQGNAVVFVASVAPTATQTGDEWIDTSSATPVVKVWNGSAWVSTSSAQTSVTIGGVSDTVENFMIESN